ncbi:MAG: ABC transporter six-transmembrane domain-containing protein [Anaerolineae bacterium]
MEKVPAYPLTTGDTLRRFRWRLALTYTLTLFETFFELLYPLMIGIAIDGLISHRPASLLPIILTWLTHAVLAAARQLYDTRIFARMYQQLAFAVVTHQSKQGISTSHLAARSALMREFVDFLEQDVAFVITITVNFVGAFVLLLLFDVVVGLYCLLILMPLFFINLLHRRTTRRLNRNLNDQLEKEVEVIESRQVNTINAHFVQVARWYIQLSDADARTWFAMQPLLLGLVVLSLIRSVELNMGIGDIFATVGYALSFTDSLHQVPFIVQQYTRLQDIADRVNTTDST